MFLSLRASERKRRLRQKELEQQQAAMREAAFQAAEDRGLTADVSIEDSARQEMVSNIMKMVQENPADTAQAIRGWVKTENE